MDATVTPPMESVERGLQNAPEAAERAVDRHGGSLEFFTRLGWLAKGVVYLLFGLTAVGIATRSPTDDEASPQGALGAVMDVPTGRLLVGVLSIGLLLYALWRTGSMIVERGSGIGDWLDRAGYAFSAVFYLLLGLAAGRAAIRGAEPGESNSVESLSQTLLGHDGGRWLLGMIGAVTIAVGIVFVVKKGVMRRFTDDLRAVDEDVSRNQGIDHAIHVGGIVGWVGRGIATSLVGFFIVRSAYTFDADEARGFDRALREATTSSAGSVLVWLSALGLCAYGAFCLLGHRRRNLADRS